MSENKTAARPYAEAVFRLAQERDELKQWSDMLVLVATVATDENIVRLIFDPNVGRERLADLFLEICGQRLNKEATNFVRLLIENRRLTLLPEIVTLFEQLKGEAEGRLDVTVLSAFALDASQERKIEQVLKRKLGREINLKTAEDKTLVGGIVIRAGDLVIDGSVSGRLQELSSHLIH